MADVQIQLGLDDSEYQRDIDGVKNNTDKAAKDSGKSLERNVGNRGAAAFKRLALAAIAAGTAIGTALFTRASIRAATEQEAVTRRLEFALQAAGEEVSNNSRKIQEFAAEIQKTTTLSNEAVEGQAALALSLGATAAQATDLVGASVDLAAALGTSLDGATQRLARTLQGDLSARLAQVIPELREFTEEQLRSGAAIDFVAQRFAGAAQSEVRTFQGAITQLSETFADLQKAFGQIVTDSTALRNVIGIIRDAFGSFEEFIVSSQGSIRDFGEQTAKAFLFVGREIERFVRGVLSFFEPFFNILVARMVQILKFFNQFGAQLQGIINVARIFTTSLVNGFNQIRLAAFMWADTLERLDVFNLTGLEGLREEIDEGILTSFRSAEESTDDLKDAFTRLLDPSEYEPQEVIDVFANLFQEIDEASRNDDGELIFDRLLSAFDEENLEPKIEAFSNATDQWSSDLLRMSSESKKAAKSINKDFVDIGEVLKNTLVNTTTSAFQEFGKQLVSGEGSFKSFVGIALNSLGDLAISIGTTVIASSLAIQAIPFSTGILLGAALVAVGGAVKAFSSKFSQSGGGSTPSNFKSGGAGAASPPPQAPDDSVQREESQRQSSQNVQLVVQGDILDSEDTGRRLVDLLNSNFESDNSALVGARFA